MKRSRQIHEYHQALGATDRAICERLYAEIEDAVPDATCKVWHRHPVWFLDANPIVGYHRLKESVRLMFWSGQSFASEGLAATGTFKAAEARFVDVHDIDIDALRSWLRESHTVQWNYRDVRRTRGQLERLTYPP